MFSILTLYTTLLSPVSLAPAPVTQPAQHVASLQIADTGTAATAAAAPGVLTQQELQGYITVNKALTAYWAAHPDRRDTVRKQAKHFQTFTQNGGVSISSPRIDYAQLAQQDTAVAAIFAHAPLTPAQFGATQGTVRQVIWAILHDESADSTTVTGRNIALVRPQRPALASDWTDLQGMQSMGTGVLNMIMNAASHSGNQQPLAP